MFNYKLLRGDHTALMLPLLLVGLLLAAPAQAVHIFSVNSDVDAADTNPGDGSCVAPIGGGNLGCTLRAAVQEANALFTAATPHTTNITIALPQGTFTLTGAANEDNAASGDLDILGTCQNASINTPCLTIKGISAVGTIINGAFLDRVFHIVGRNTVKITGLTIQNGRAANDSGGGIKNTNGWVTLENCRVTNSDAGTATGSGGYGGGGIYNGVSAQMVINDCVIRDNQIYNFDTQGPNAFVGGGGIYNSGVLTLKKSYVESNTGRPFGAGIQNNKGPTAASGVLTVEDSIIRDNKSTSFVNAGGVGGSGSTGSGGGISNHGGAVILTRTIVRANEAIDGGGVSNVSGVSLNGTVDGSLRVIASVIDGNKGGGIFNQGSVDISYSTISANSAPGFGYLPDGAGIHNRAPGSVLVANSTITRNVAVRSGGGIFNGRSMTLTNVTLSGNQANNGREIFASVDPTQDRTKLLNSLQNTIISGDAVGTAPLFPGVLSPFDCMSGFQDAVVAIVPADNLVTSVGNNLERGDSCALRGPNDRPNTAAGLDVLSQSGIATETLLLDNTHPAVFVPLPGSAAIGAGTCINKFDQRLYGRPNAGCDIGAVERDGEQGVSKVDLEVAITGNVPTVSLDNPVTYTIKVTNNGPATALGVTLAVQIPSGTTYVVSYGANQVTVACSSSATGRLSCSLASDLVSGASFTVFVVVTPVSGFLGGTVMETRTRVDAASPGDYLPGNNGSLDTCSSGGCVLTAIVQPNNNFGASDGGGGSFGSLDLLLLLGAPGALLLRRRKTRV